MQFAQQMQILFFSRAILRLVYGMAIFLEVLFNCIHCLLVVKSGKRQVTSQHVCRLMYECFLVADLEMTGKTYRTSSRYKIL